MDPLLTNKVQNTLDRQEKKIKVLATGVPAEHCSWSESCWKHVNLYLVLPERFRAYAKLGCGRTQKTEMSWDWDIWLWQLSLWGASDKRLRKLTC